MSQSKNPVVGYIACSTPDCGCACTVHQVGAHKAATSGEAPKNKRRLGLYYTLCPKCGADQRSGGERQAYIKANLQDSADKALSDSGLNRALPSSANDETFVKADETTLTATETETVTELTVIDSETFTNNDATQTEDKPLKSGINPVAIGGIVALLLGGLAFYLKGKTKPEPQGV
ncbi:hypothetical protein [Thaumasiovibrio sp. DFM-14]|uniref:hypothetical protein n=1 Tax=Thaumasiovibrio sp. DFM-14 TaxID=3384792 RepID=UPI00399F10B7